MVKDYSQQTGKKTTTKGHHKICISIESIVYIQCEGGLATLFLDDQSKVEEIKTLKAFEADLCGMGFIRISRNTLVNGKHITKINTNQGKRIVYLGDIALRVSKRRLACLKEQLF